MSVPSDLIVSIIVAGLVAAVLIVCTHMLVATRITRLAAYVVGVAEVGLVLTGWGIATGHTDTILAYWGVFGIAGAADVLAWWIRARLESITDEVEGNAFLRGQIAGPDHSREAANDKED